MDKELNDSKQSKTKQNSDSLPYLTISPLIHASDGLSIQNDNIRLSETPISTSLPKHFSPRLDRRLTSRESVGSRSTTTENGLNSQSNKSDIDVRDQIGMKHRFKGETCSLTSRNSDADDEEEADFGDKNGDDFFSSNSLPLTPFKNQVGGHASFLRFSEKALCKPLDKREQSFYEHISSEYPQLLPFVATYLGVVNVSFKSSTNTPVILLEHNKHLLGGDDVDSLETAKTLSLPKHFNKIMQQQVFRDALSPKGLRARFAQLKSVDEVMRSHTQWTDISKPKSISEEPETPDAKGHTSDVDQIFQMSDDDFLTRPSPVKFNLPQSSPLYEAHDANPAFDSFSLEPLTIRKIGESKAPLRHINPWSAHLYNTKMASRTETDAIQQFLLLEDLTEGLQYPCILDLKMGTRQHGVFATPEKKVSQERKCERSTSKRLGLYRNDTQQYQYLDKYVGRQINVANFKQSLLSFIDNGTHYQIGHIPLILSKLRKLYESLLILPSFRFYASSLLILYDGANNSKKQADIRMIDFANCVTSLTTVCNYPPTTAGPDGGYLLGLRTLIFKFEELYTEIAGDGSNLDADGHVCIATMSKTQRASAQIGPSIKL